MKVLFANVPWHKLPEDGISGWIGVKAGSRWPHQLPYYGGLLAGTYVPFPFFLATAAALAERQGFATVIRDSIALGETYDSFYEFFSQTVPDVVVIETTTPSFSNDLEILKQLKAQQPWIITVLTGMHQELEQVTFLDRYPCIDFIVYGEYEKATVALLQAIKIAGDVSIIQGLLYRNKEKKSVKNSFGKLTPLEELPWPMRVGLPNANYYDSVCGLEKPQLQIQASRGCPFQCIFCAWPQIMYRGTGYRIRQPEEVIAEINHHFEQGRYNSFYFDDDTFNVCQNHVIRIAQLIKKSRLAKIPWGIMARPDLMTEEILHQLKDANIYSIKYGLESGNVDILAGSGKNMNLQHAIKMIKLTKKLGIRVHLTFTFGLPGDTRKTIHETIDLACKLPADMVQFSIATPFPGTKMHEIYMEKGWLLSKEWEDYNGASTAVTRTEELSADELEELIKFAYRKWSESISLLNLGSKEFYDKLSAALADIQAGSRLLVTQSATLTLTKQLICILQSMNYRVHLLLHERFLSYFVGIVAQEQLHIFYEPGNFHYEELADFADDLQQKYHFTGALIPYSNPTGAGYEEVHKVALAATQNIIAGIGNDGTIYK